MATVKKIEIDRINSLIGKIFSKDEIIDLDTMNIISDVSANTGCEVILVVSRSSEILDAKIGTKDRVDIEIDHNTRRGMSQIRVIHTHPNASAQLSNLDISMLKNNRLDMIVAISVKDGKCYDAQVAMYDGENIHKTDLFDARFINKLGLFDKMRELESTMKSSIATDQNLERAVLVGVKIGKDKYFDNLEELKSLAKTNHIEVVGTIIQSRDKPDPKYYLGEGKLKELHDLVQLNDANLVIFDNDLSGTRNTALEGALGVKVIDRSRLILDIFAGRAKTKEGKLQVELAQLKYSLPRLSSIAGSSGRFGSSGTGMRGPGESKLELNRRVVARNITKIENELLAVKKQRNLSRNLRQKNNKVVVAIVGYTNSGKSTLLNKLTRSDIYAKDELFATLDTTTRTLYLGEGCEVLLVDTVGFISRLPHEFIEAFSSTLEETVYADIILHVIDITNPNYVMQERVVCEMLDKLNAKGKIIRVYSKVDKYKGERKNSEIYISSVTGEGLDKLKTTIYDLAKTIK